MLEVLAYAAEEAECVGAGHALVVLYCDGSVSVADDGRGTDTRIDDRGRVVRKPVMATKDVRFFDHPRPPLLADDWPRRGVSVVAALSDWLLHTNRRCEHGLPTGNLAPLPDGNSTGTTVHFRPSGELVSPTSISASELDRVASALGGHLVVEIQDQS